jgi:hypothetical protein
MLTARPEFLKRPAAGPPCARPGSPPTPATPPSGSPSDIQALHRPTPTEQVQLALPQERGRGWISGILGLPWMHGIPEGSFVSGRRCEGAMPGRCRVDDIRAGWMVHCRGRCRSHWGAVWGMVDGRCPSDAAPRMGWREPRMKPGVDGADRWATWCRTVARSRRHGTPKDSAGSARKDAQEGVLSASAAILTRTRKVQAKEEDRA